MSIAVAFAALVVAQIALVLPVADFLTRKLSGEQPVRGLPAGTPVLNAA